MFVKVVYFGQVAIYSNKNKTRGGGRVYRIITPNDAKRSFELCTDIAHFRLHHGSIRFSLDNPVADILRGTCLTRQGPTSQFGYKNYIPGKKIESFTH